MMDYPTQPFVSARLTDAYGDELVEWSDGFKLAVIHSMQRAFVIIPPEPKPPVRQRVLLAMPPVQFVAA